MESFYGGQQGFSFVVKRNPAENHDGCFYNVNEINTAARKGVLRYGDYAIVTNTINNYTIEHGDLYRINTQGTAEKVANISHPALSTLISGFSGVHPNPPEGQSVEIDFLSEAYSKTANKLEMTWTYVTDSDSQIIGIEIGIAAPQPVIEFELEKTNSYKKQIQSEVTGGPFYKKFKVQEPRQVDIISSNTTGGNNLSSEDIEDGLIIFNERTEKIELKNYTIYQGRYPESSSGSIKNILRTDKINISSWSKFTIQYTGLTDASLVKCYLVGYDLTQLISEYYPPKPSTPDTVTLQNFLTYIEENGVYRPLADCSAYLEMILVSDTLEDLQNLAESLIIKSYF